MALYPDVAVDVAQACRRYRDRLISEEELQQHLWKAAQTIVAIEEKDLREYLQHAEGQLELLRFTVDGDRVYDSALPLVSEIEKRVAEYLSP